MFRFFDMYTPVDLLAPQVYARIHEQGDSFRPASDGRCSGMQEMSLNALLSFSSQNREAFMQITNARLLSR